MGEAVPFVRVGEHNLRPAFYFSLLVIGFKTRSEVAGEAKDTGTVGLPVPASLFPLSVRNYNYSAASPFSLVQSWRNGARKNGNAKTSVLDITPRVLAVNPNQTYIVRLRHKRGPLGGLSRNDRGIVAQQIDGAEFNQLLQVRV
jgi:hypothetical protein